MKPEPGTGTAPQPGRLPPIIDLGRALARNDIEYGPRQGFVRDPHTCAANALKTTVF